MNGTVISKLTMEIRLCLVNQKNESPISAAEMPQASSSPNTEPPQPQESVDHANVENSGSHGMSKLMKNMKVRFKRINMTTFRDRIVVINSCDFPRCSAKDEDWD